MVLAYALAAHPAAAKPKIHHARHKAHGHIPAGVASSASYADIVIDAESGEILHATDPDHLRHPASLTKMMTLYLTFQALEAGRVGPQPISAGVGKCGRTIALQTWPAPRVSAFALEDAILGVVTKSANDAAVVLGEWLGGSEAGFAP